MDLHPGKFSYLLKVKEADIDEMGHVNNVVYLRWVQEVAVAHWYHIASETQRNQLKWVVLRHEINYYKPAFLTDTIMGFTWVSEYQGAKFDRFVSLFKADTHVLIAEAKTTWCLLDAQTLKPKRIDETIWSIL